MNFGARSETKKASRRFNVSERQILPLLCAGRSSTEISRELRLRKISVEETTKAIYQKLGVRNQAAAVKAIVRLGMLDDDASQFEE